MPAFVELKINSWGEVVLDKRELRALMRSAGNEVKRKTASLIGKTEGSGRAYYRGGRRYRASSPGNPPVFVSGALRNSLRVYTWKDGSGFAVRERQFYSLFLEAGARGGGGRKGSTKNRRHRRGMKQAAFAGQRVLEPRPHLDRVMQEQAPEIDRRVRLAMEKGLKWRETR